MICIVYYTVMPVRKEYNKLFFKKWSYDMAYVLGFMFADGNIVKTKRGTHFLSIYTADKQLLERMRNIMDSTHVISERVTKAGCTYRLQIGSKEWFDDVAQWGLFPNKTSRMDVPDIPKKYVGPFVRGYFDGDGNVWQGYINQKRRIPTKVLYVAFTSSSSDFLLSLRKLVWASGISGGSLYKVKKGTYGRLSFSTLDALKLYKIMYNAPCDLYLERKKSVFERFAEERSRVRA